LESNWNSRKQGIGKEIEVGEDINFITTNQNQPTKKSHFKFEMGFFI
jgi:hypothetical protein